MKKAITKCFALAIVACASFAVGSIANAQGSPHRDTHHVSERFLLTCGNGPCVEVCYTVCYPSGVAAIGTTDKTGRTKYYRTEDPQSLKLFLGHHLPGDCEEHGPLGIHVTREIRPD